MHNSILDNLLFAESFSETNLRYLLGDTSPDAAKEEKVQKDIVTIREQIKAERQRLASLPA